MLDSMARDLLGFALTGFERANIGPFKLMLIGLLKFASTRL
uniref:Uncharacterized protein n=1 Tax=viral metagenome TaxID=1070528 RepID=A0A6C0C9E1_9ZZZZ